MTERRIVEKNFDDPEVRALPGSIERFWSEEAYAFCGPPSDVHTEIARVFNERQIPLVLDIGCGTGALARELRGRWVGVDISIEQLREAEGHRALTEATRLPFADETFPGAAALYMLYFFADPRVVVAEARRVLRAGGLFAVCAPSRYDTPELAHVLPAEDESFVSEDIPAVLEGLFEDIEITSWNAPFFHLRTPEDVRDYLYSWHFPAISLDDASRRAQEVETPLKVTKRGAFGFGRKRA